MASLDSEAKDFELFRKYASERYRIHHALKDNKYAGYSLDRNFREVMANPQAHALLVQLLLEFGAGKILAEIDGLHVSQPIFMTHHVGGTRPSKHTDLLTFVRQLLRFTRLEKNKQSAIQSNIASMELLLKKLKEAHNG